MTDQTFTPIRWLASELLLRRGFLRALMTNGIDAVMADCDYGALTDKQQATVEAMMADPDAVDALQSFWDAYDSGRLTGDVPAAVEAGNPWLD